MPHPSYPHALSYRQIKKKDRHKTLALFLLHNLLIFLTLFFFLTFTSFANP